MSEERGLNICGTLEKIWKCGVDNMLNSAGGEGVRGRRNNVSCHTNGILFVKYRLLFMILAVERSGNVGKGEILLLALEIIGERCCTEV